MKHAKQQTATGTATHVIPPHILAAKGSMTAVVYTDTDYQARAWVHTADGRSREFDSTLRARMFVEAWAGYENFLSDDLCEAHFPTGEEGPADDYNLNVAEFVV